MDILGYLMKLSIIIPCFNEEKNLKELIERISLSLNDVNSWEYEMIFVNDDSTDHSQKLLEKHHARNKRIKIINMARRFGVTECVFAGLGYASGDAVIYMDCDLQDPPELITDLLLKWRAGADMVYTVRVQRDGEKPIRMFFTKQAYRIIGAFSEVDLPVEAGDFRLLDKKVVCEILKLPETEPYLRGLTNWVGFRQAKVEYKRASRAGGATHFPGVFSVSAVQQFMRGVTSFSFFPLFVLLGIGVIVFGTSLTILFFALALHFTQVFWSPWVYALILAFLFWGGIISALGVIGLYIARIYSDVRGRPRFIIKDTSGFDI